MQECHVMSRRIPGSTTTGIPNFFLLGGALLEVLDLLHYPCLLWIYDAHLANPVPGRQRYPLEKKPGPWDLMAPSMILPMKNTDFEQLR